MHPVDKLPISWDGIGENLWKKLAKTGITVDNS
jgi:hypothetical protein